MVWTTVRYSFELGTIEKGLEQRLVRYRPILYVHVCILGYILKPFGGRVGPPWAGPYTAKNVIPIRRRKRARYGTELQYRYVHLGQSHCIFCMGSALQLESTCNPSVGSRP